MHLEKYWVVDGVSLAFEVGEKTTLPSQENVALRKIYILKTQQRNKQPY